MQMHVHTCMQMHVQMCTKVCTHTHTHIYTHIHTIHARALPLAAEGKETETQGEREREGGRDNERCWK